MAVVDRILRAVEAVLVWIAAATTAVILALATAEILARGLFNAPIRGQLDLITLAMPFAAILGISRALTRNAHVRMPLVVDALPQRARHIVEAAGMGLGAFICAVLSIGAYQFFERALAYSDNTPDLRIPTWPVKLMISASLALLAVRFALYALVHLRLVRDPADAAAEALLPAHRTLEDVTE
ncbi:TRAP transporter small permease [Acuticoccus mangrovi]|uniref:TRAP transporter small permease protein n=1 Tax=Acuticoccus mangrovi TaxID=2796142 RepID=A0A934ISW8_9HYPH|nr:TRAP transporter small permease [Acuticoccus mangrovi]MBJ3778028.1 TRAP transporter small permease [Acuticoccus mangrovi]